MEVTFLVFAALWVLAWVVLIVLALVKILFPIPDEAYGELDLPGEGRAG